MILPDDIDEKIEIWVGETDSEDSESDLSDHETKSTRHHRHPHPRSNSQSQSQSLSRRHSHGRPASASAPECDGKRDLCRDIERKQRRSRTKEAREDGHVRRLVLGNGLEVKVGRRSPSHGKGKGESDNVFILRKQLEAVTSNSNANREQPRQPKQPQYPPGLGLDLGLDESTSSPAKNSHVKRDCNQQAHLQPHSQTHCQPYTHAHAHTHTHNKSTLSSTSLTSSLSRPRRHGQGPIGLGLDLLSNVTRPSRLFTSKRRSSSSLRSQRGTGTAGTQAAAANTDDDNVTVIMPAASTSKTMTTTMPQTTIERRYSIESIDGSVRGSPRRSSRAHIDGTDAAATEGHEKNRASLPRGEIARESEAPIDAAGVSVNGGPGLLQQVRAWAWQLWASPLSSSSS